ncbi:MAG: YkgJ family cysteine cluster protein [Minicystis sp.]
MITARARLAELFAKVDAFFAKVHARFPDEDGVTCHAGCDDCCRRRFSVTAIEAEVIAEALAALPEARREALADRARGGDPGVCPALDEGGRCAVYEARPLICRTHGLPIRFAAPPAGKRALPVQSEPTIDACPKNFAGRDLAVLPADAVLDQTTLSTILGALDAARAAELGAPRGERVDIAAILAAR